MKRYSVTIIGMGPRGLSILERLALSARSSACTLQVNLIETGECGPGTDSELLPAHLVTGAAGQLSAFAPRAAREQAGAFPTSTLAAWARAAGYRRFGERIALLAPEASEGEPISDDDVLPRSLYGRYLVWAYRAVAAALPPTVRLSHLRHRAVDMFQQPDGSFVVELDSGFSVNSDFVFLATGHCPANLTDEQAWCRKFAQDHARYNSKLVYIRDPRPRDQLARLGGDARVAISGMGLAAHDIIAELTIGRGGRFVAAGSGLRYLACGHEPRLLMYSRSSLPALARVAAPAPVLHFFTHEALHALRERALRERASSQLDFDRDLWPLLHTELAYAWRCAEAGPAGTNAAGYVAGAAELAGITALLFPLRERSFDSGAAFRTFVTCLLADDLCEARRGSTASPAKAAAAALVAARPVLQEAIAHGGLTAVSQRKFLSVYHPAFRRVAYGPPAERNEQLLALIDAGVLELAGAPNPAVRIDEERSQFTLHARVGGTTELTCVDALVLSWRDPFSPQTADDELMRNLLKRGTVRPYYNGAFHPGGVDLDGASHPLDRSGRCVPNVWVGGALAAGPLYLPDSGTAAACVRELFSIIGARESAVEPGRARAAAVHGVYS
jgi:hypothetical protein